MATPSQSEIIRGWLELQDRHCTAPEIAAAIGRPGDRAVYFNVHRMWREGVLSREGRCKHYAFQIAREVRRPLQRDERKRRRAERERARRRRQGKAGRTWAEWKAECDARKAATRAALEAAKAKRTQEREAERAERLAEQEAERAARKHRRRQRRIAPANPRHHAPIPALRQQPERPPEIRRESVEEFLRRGGRVERLEAAWS